MTKKQLSVFLYSIIAILFLLGVYEMKTGDVMNLRFYSKNGGVFYATVTGKLLITISIIMSFVCFYILNRNR
jgi:hypothetical protein